MDPASDSVDDAMRLYVKNESLVRTDWNKEGRAKKVRKSPAEEGSALVG